MFSKENLSNLGFLLNDAAGLVRRRFAQKARAHDLTATQWRAITQLQRSGAVNQAELAGLLESEPMTICRLVERMETSGLVERVPDPADRRAKLVRLTPKTMAILDDVRKIAAVICEEALEGLSNEESAALMSALSRLNDNLAKRVATGRQAVA